MAAKEEEMPFLHAIPPQRPTARLKSNFAVALSDLCFFFQMIGEENFAAFVLLNLAFALCS